MELGDLYAYALPLRALTQTDRLALTVCRSVSWLWTFAPLSSLAVLTKPRAAIDDTLPVTPEKLPMCALMKEQDQLWPALLEKAVSDEELPSDCCATAAEMSIYAHST